MLLVLLALNPSVGCVADTQKLLVQFVQSVNEKYSDTYTSVKASMPTELSAKLDHCLTIDVNTIPAGDQKW